MYSDADLEGAITAGILKADDIAAFRNYMAGERATPLADEEHFRLLTGFNDIFVAIAGTLLLVAVGWIAGTLVPALGAASVAAASWGLAEYFTRKRRMALPSILFLLAFVGGVFWTGAAMFEDMLGETRAASEFAVAAAAAVAAGAAWLHWRRFHVPITIAAGAAALVGLVLSLLVAAVPKAQDWLAVLMFVAGLGVFAFAMRWDMSDPARRTRRADVAFWLHLIASPLIVHPVFALMGLLEGDATAVQAVTVILLYVGLGLVALAIDRRALMVSALFYVLYALSALFQKFGAVGINVALTGLVIGSALLLLSAFWSSARRAILARLPSKLAQRLPSVA